MLRELPATFRFIEFFSDFFCSNTFIFEPKVKINIYECFFHSILATDLEFGAKNNVRTIQSRASDHCQDHAARVERQKFVVPAHNRCFKFQFQLMI